MLKVKRKPKIKTYRWFKWHSQVGVFGGLLMFLICWGGSFAVVSHEIDWLVNPMLRVKPIGEPASLVDIYEKVIKAYPEAKIRAVQKPLYENFASQTVIEIDDKQILRVYVDQYLMKITGSTPFFNIQRYFRDFHQGFYRLFGYGKLLVTLFSFLLIGSLVSALYFYRGWWKHFFSIKVKEKGSRSFWSSIHKVVGLWSIWFVLVIGITGLWYLYEKVSIQYAKQPFSYVDTFSNAAKPLPKLDANKSKKLNFSQLVKKIKIARPNLEIDAIYPDRGGYLYAVGQAEHILVRNRANKIFVNPYNGKITYNQKASDLSAYWRWSDTADPLHFGSFGGIIGKLIWFVFGIFLSFLSLTGTWLYIKRLQKTKQKIYHKGSVVVSFMPIIIFLYTMVAPFIYLKKIGPVVDSMQIMAIPSFGVTVFLFVWIVSTLLICLGWVWILFRYRGKEFTKQK